MSKGIIIVVVLILLGGGAYYINEQNKEAARLEQIQLQEAEEARRVAAEQAKQRAIAQEAKRVAQQAKQKALEEARRIEAEAQRAKQLAMDEAKRLEEAAKLKAEEIKSKFGDLIAQAKSSLESGNYQEAINSAKNVLSQDAGNSEAQSILDTAMAKIKEFAQKQAVSAVKEDPKKALDAITSGISLP